MKPKHTNGEWKVKGVDSDGRVNITNGRAIPIAKVLSENGKVYECGLEQQANAKLIAAAPELLDALKDCEKLLSIYAESTESSLNNKGADAQIWRNAKQAINKTK